MSVAGTRATLAAVRLARALAARSRSASRWPDQQSTCLPPLERVDHAAIYAGLIPCRSWGTGAVQASLRAAGLVFVVAWLFVEDLRAWIPFWLPLVVLLAAEVEFVLRGRHDGPRGRRGRFGPGPEDADLGFGELVEDEDGLR